MDPQRDVTVVLGGLSRKSKSITIDGLSLDCTFNPDTKEASVALPVAAADQSVTVTIKY